MIKTTDTHERIEQYLHERRTALLDFLMRLVATPSPNPPGDVRAVVGVIQDELRMLGLPAGEVLSCSTERPNLVVRLEGSGDGPTLLLNGHTDTKPVTDPDRELWLTDPLVPTLQDDRLYGLGASDMKGGIAAIVYAAAALWHAARPVGHTLLVFVSDEEAGFGHGAQYLVDAGRLPAADFGLVAEPNGVRAGTFEYLPLTSRGTFYFKVKVHGTQTHASISDQIPAVNASVKMAWALWRMSRDLHLTFQPHPYLPQGPTVTPGVMVSGGVYLGVHPGYAEFSTDVRLIPGMTHEQIRADIEKFLASLQAEDPALDAEVEVIGGSIQAELSGTEAFVTALLDASERVLGRRPPFGAYPAFTDAFHFHRRAGIPTVPGYGPGRITDTHMPNEWVGVESVNQAAAIYALAAAAYLGSSAS